MSVELDLGRGHVLRMVVDGRGRVIGGVHMHPWPGAPDGGGFCYGSIRFDNEAAREIAAIEAAAGRPVRPVWSVLCDDPLTLSPSIQCRGGCGVHGYITDGRWHDA